MRGCCVECTKLLAKSAFFAIAAAHASLVYCGEFTARSGSDGVTLTCPDAGPVGARCELSFVSGREPAETIAVQFQTERTPYRTALKQGAESATAGSTLRFPQSPSELSALGALSFDQCHAAEQKWTDAFQLCALPEPDKRMILFMRAPCDQCEFEPIVLTSHDRGSFVFTPPVVAVRPPAGFQFDMTADSQDADVLEYRYGWIGREESKDGRAYRGDSVGGGDMPNADFLYVKWRNRTSKRVYQDTVDLRKRLPADAHRATIYFMINGAQLSVYLIYPEPSAPGAKPVGPAVWSDHRVATIYP